MFWLDVFMALVQQVFSNIQLFLKVVMLCYLVIKMLKFLLELVTNVLGEERVGKIAICSNKRAQMSLCSVWTLAKCSSTFLCSHKRHRLDASFGFYLLNLSLSSRCIKPTGESRSCCIRHAKSTMLWIILLNRFPK